MARAEEGTATLPWARQARGLFTILAPSESVKSLHKLKIKINHITYLTKIYFMRTGCWDQYLDFGELLDSKPLNNNYFYLMPSFHDSKIMHMTAILYKINTNYMHLNKYIRGSSYIFFAGRPQYLKVVLQMRC